MVVNELSLPNLIIGGVNKAATTSLYTYLARHKDIARSSIKETNYFIPIVFGVPLKPIEVYSAYFKDHRARKYRMEASPRYIFGGTKLAQAIRDCLGPIRIIFVFRRPIDRLLSYFKHMKTTAEIPPEMSADDYARRSLQELPAVLERVNGNSINVYRETIFVRGLAQGFYADYLEEWYSVFPDSIKVCFFEDLKKDPRAVVRDLFSWLDIDDSEYDSSKFTQENRSITHGNKSLFAIAEYINVRGEPFWRRHPRMKDMIRNAYCWLNEERADNAGFSKPILADLNSVYAPYNERLKALLCQRGYKDFPEWISGQAR